MQCPINPSDVNTVQGKYPLMPKLPGTPGHEGVGEVVAKGDEVRVGQHLDWEVGYEGRAGRAGSP